MQQLYDHNGQRKYLAADDREAFLKAAENAESEIRTFCGILAYTGCRISEALVLTATGWKHGVIIFETLKKRRSGVYRAVPAPPAFLDTLNMGKTSGPPRSAGTGGKAFTCGTGLGPPHGGGSARSWRPPALPASMPARRDFGTDSGSRQ
jgi:integrase